MSTLTNILGHFHPALVHFPVALLTVGAIFEAFSVLRGKEQRSIIGRALLIFGFLGAGAAVLSGLSHFDAAAYRDRTLEVALIHRVLGLTTLALATLTGLLGGFWKTPGPQGGRLWIYRILYATTAGGVGLTGHYGGWVVFGWGQIWTF